MRQQAKRLFYIGKQLVSNNFGQILEGLYKSRIFIQQITIPQYINTLIMSLLDLFNTTKISYIRYTISQIIPMTFDMIASLPSRPQFVSILTQCLKSNDAMIRILTLGIIGKLYNLFMRDSSIYHFLLGKLGKRGENVRNVKRDQISVKEFVGVVGCLKALLKNSEFLAGIFSNNLKELNQLGGVDLKIICYLCVYAKFQERSYEKILKSMHELCQPYLTTNNKFYKHYLTRLILKSCNTNYLCIKYFLTTNLQHKFPHLKQKISKIQYQYYNFLISQTPSEPENNTEINYVRLFNCTELLDLCYEHFSMYGRIPDFMEEEVKAKINQDFGNGVVRAETVLLSFFCSYNYRRLSDLDEKLTLGYQIQQQKKQTPTNPNQNTKMLKIALITCNYKLSKKLLNYLSNQDQQLKLSQRNMSILMLFQAYVDFHSDPNIENLLGFLIIVNNLAIIGKHRQLQVLVSKWRKFYAQELENSQNFQYLKEYELGQGDQQKMIDQAEQTALIKCKQQFEIMKQDSEISMPFWNEECQPYYKIYFGKRTILDIFHYL